MLFLTIVILLAGPPSHLRKGNVRPVPCRFRHTDLWLLDDSYMLLFA